MDGKKIGDYEIIEKLTGKGIGVLYKGKIGDRTVLLKVIPPQMTADDEFKDRFLREMEVVSRLDHPNIVLAFDFGMDVHTGTYYLAFEYLEGETLAEGLVKVKTFPLPMALSITRQVAKGLHHAYEKEIIHRNINPENIFLGNDGSVKITNMGLAKFMSKSNITQAGTMLGTPLYMAPEQALQDTVDIRGDIYSLGITLFYMISGRPPFESKVPMKIIEAHCYTPLPPLSEFVENVPDAVEKLIQKMCAKKPEERYSTPEELVEALGEVMKGV